MSALRRVGVAPWLPAAGLLAVAAGVLPADDAEDVLDRVLPLLLFLGSVVVLAELVREAEVFDVAAAWLARRGRGRPVALFLLCTALATLTTVTLNLDTTAVLLTPVLLALATRIGVAPLPLAMTTVWLANTGSLLLPVSNLTTVLAASRIGLGAPAFAVRMVLPALVAVLVTAALLWVCFWRPALRTTRGGGYAVPPRHRPADPVLAGAALAAAVLFVAGVLAGLPIGVASSVGALVAVVACAVRRRPVVRPGRLLLLVPWRLLVLVPGVFLVVQAVVVHGLGTLAADLVAGDPYRAAGVGAVLANLVNNLPAYLAGEGAVPSGDRTALLGLLIGVNCGPVVTPWASLATLIWFERCRAAGLTVPWGRFVGFGAVLAVLVVPLATVALVTTA